MAREIDNSRIESRAEETTRGGFGNFDILSEMKSYQAARRNGNDTRASQEDRTSDNIQVAQNSDKPATPLVLRPQTPRITSPYTINGDGTVNMGRGASQRVDTWTINK